VPPATTFPFKTYLFPHISGEDEYKRARRTTLFVIATSSQEGHCERPNKNSYFTAHINIHQIISITVLLMRRVRYATRITSSGGENSFGNGDNSNGCPREKS